MMDRALSEAISEVVDQAGQPKSVATRLTAWLNELSKGDLGRDENTQFLANVLGALVLEERDAD